MKYAQVNLNKKVVKRAGARYSYWCLRWAGSNGKRHYEYIGRADGPKKLSKRQANVLSNRKQMELNEHPGRRDVGRSDTLSKFLKLYLKSRKIELAIATYKLHTYTARYLLAFFGETVRIDQITKSNARAFKTALGDGELIYVNERKRVPCAQTVDRICREARTMFNHALTDDLIISNPFGKLGGNSYVLTDWHYVAADEFKCLIEAAPNLDWRVFLSLCRFAALRKTESLELLFENINWENHRLTIIAKKRAWMPKDKKPRTIPLCPELYNLLLQAHEAAKPGQQKVISGIVPENTWRDFQVIRKRSGVAPYESPLHSLRKSCALDWAQNNVQPHVLQEWMGHSKFETTMRYYLKVSESEYKRIAETSLLKESGAKSGAKKQKIT